MPKENEGYFPYSAISRRMGASASDSLFLICPKNLCCDFSIFATALTDVLVKMQFSHKA